MLFQLGAHESTITSLQFFVNFEKNKMHVEINIYAFSVISVFIIDEIYIISLYIYT